MFELAKTVLTKAGGNSSTSLFTQATASQNHHGPHRALHMCAFQLGLYALGLHNCVSPNWLSRTYSSHVSWITGRQQVLKILKDNNETPKIDFLKQSLKEIFDFFQQSFIFHLKFLFLAFKIFLHHKSKTCLSKA